jgi:hypothetical protein
MGTTLNGTTPATTYDALIKVGDNGPIDGTLKTLSDGLGNDLPMQASSTVVNFTNGLQQGGTAVPTAAEVASKQATLVSGTNIKTINSNSLLGSGDIAISASPSGVAGAIQFSDGSAFASDATNLFWDDTNNRLGVGTNTPTATTHIVGIDQLSTSTSLLVQDSIGTNILRVHNQANNSAVVMTTAKIANYEIISGDVLFNTSMRFVPTTGGVAINKDYSSASSNTLVHLKGSGTTSATTSLLVQNSAGTEVLKVTDDSVTNARNSFNVLHPSVVTRSLRLGWGSIFATDSNSELTIGAVWTVPSAPQILLAGNTRGSGPNTMQLQASAGVSIATSLINPSAQLHVKGSGSTSATTALLVQNSAGTQLLRVKDDGQVQLGSSSNFTVDGNTTYNRFELAVGGLSSIPSAVLSLTSTTRGFLPPRMTTTQKNAISTPASGLQVYDTTLNQMSYYNGTTWVNI